MADVIDVDMPAPAAPPPPAQKKRSHDVIDLLEDDDVVIVAPPKKPRPEVVDVDALDSDDDADDNGERGLGPPRVVKPEPPRALAVKADPCPPQRPVPKLEPRGPPLVAKREPKKEPKKEVKPKVELDDDGDQPMFTLKKKKKKAAAPSPARLSEDGSDDDEPAEPPPPRSAFPQWLKAREDAGDAPPLDPDQRRACDCIVVQSKNTFVTGSGGNGKSHVTRTILDFFEKHYGDQHSPV
jgi:hypothetical protein